MARTWRGRFCRRPRRARSARTVVARRRRRAGQRGSVRAGFVHDQCLDQAGRERREGRRLYPFRRKGRQPRPLEGHWLQSTARSCILHRHIRRGRRHDHRRMPYGRADLQVHALDAGAVSAVRRSQVNANAVIAEYRRPKPALKFNPNSRGCRRHGLGGNPDHHADHGYPDNDNK